MSDIKRRLKGTQLYQNIIKDSFVHRFYSFVMESQITINLRTATRKLKDLVGVIYKPKLFMLHLKLRKVFEKQKKEWPHFVYSYGYFYQGYQRIGVTGIRPTERRVELYGIRSLLQRDMEVLDVASNTGFFSMELSSHVQSVDAVEWNPYLSEIGCLVSSFLGIKNVNFINASFNDFVPKRKYDIICSFANYNTTDGGMRPNISKHFEKLNSFLKMGGLLLFESHPEDAHEEFEKFIETLEDIFLVEKKMYVSDNLFCGKRLFYYLRKK